MQYVEREPRFYASVAYNGATWYLLNEPDNANKDKQIFIIEAVEMDIPIQCSGFGQVLEL